MSFHVPTEYSQPHPIFGVKGEGNNGWFVFTRNGIVFKCQASDGEGWEHVSVSLNKNRCPTWGEMCIVKDLFWDKDDCVVQFHPPESEYVSMAKYCLHLWRPTDGVIRCPESILVGVK